jgi:uncharacterized protein YkwD
MNLLTLALLTTTTAAVPSGNVAKAVAARPALLTIEQNIVQQTNSHRSRFGLPPLQVDHQLMQSARHHAAWMARNRVMRHTSAMVAENIAAGQSSSGEAVSDWMNSPGHRANILSGSYSRIGVAAYRGHDGQVYWCQQFLW